jgi:hypothetical protein
MMPENESEPRQLHALRRGLAGRRLVAGLWRGLRFAVRTAFVPLLDVQSVASRSPGDAPKAFSEPSSLSSESIRPPNSV